MDIQQSTTLSDVQSETPEPTTVEAPAELSQQDEALLEAPDLASLEFLLDEIEDQIAPLA